MPEQIVIKQSKKFLALVTLFCAGATWLGLKGIGDFSLMGALGHGKLVGKIAFFTIIMGIFTVLGLLATFIPMRKLTIDHMGIRNEEMGNKFFLPWADLESAQAGKGHVVLHTSSGPLKVGVGQYANKRILQAIETFRGANRPQGKNGRLFN